MFVSRHHPLLTSPGRAGGGSTGSTDDIAWVCATPWCHGFARLDVA